MTIKYSRIGHYGGDLTDSRTQHHGAGYYLASPVSSEDRSSRSSSSLAGRRCSGVMAEHGVDLSALPKEIREQLAELDLELSEGKGWIGDRMCTRMRNNMPFSRW